MIEIRQPNITAKTETEQLLQMRSYLYQLSQQLQWAFSTISSGGGGESSANYRSTVSGNGGGMDTAQALNTFAALKNLIIKSADIVDAYSEEINKRLQGIYVAQSDFGTYTEQTANEIRANNTGIQQLYSNTRTIESSLDRLGTVSQDLSGAMSSMEATAQNLAGAVDKIAADADSMSDRLDAVYAATIETNAYVKTGLLYENDDGTPVYGLEIGQTNDLNGVTIFSKFARFCADRLSFYDANDTEVAYISDYKLHITNAEITGSLSLAGRFRIYYNNGLAFQWTGGDS